MSLTDQGSPVTGQGSTMGLTTLQNIVSAINGLTQVTKQAGATTAGVRTQRLVTASPIAVQPNDNIINVNISAGTPACTLPLASSRNGLALSFKDVGGNFGAHALTLTASGGDTIDGLTSVTLNTARQYINLVPANDGTTTGWSIE
jgi:hypothetical protein